VVVICWDDYFGMWGVLVVFMRYIELRLFVNIYVGFISWVVSFIVSYMTVNSALSIFWSLRSLNDNLIFLSLLYIPYPTILLSLSDSLDLDGIKESFV
jgi:hypothetical protein